VQTLFPSLKTLTLSSNNLKIFPEVSTSNISHSATNVATLTIENNIFESLECLPAIHRAFPSLKTLSLQGNRISKIGFLGEDGRSYPDLDTLSLSRNQISDYVFVDALPTIFPHLISLRISNNPLHELSDNSSAAFNKSRQSDATYFLTLARIRTLKTLNYTTITTRDREEGEIYYIYVAEKDIEPSFRTVANDPAALKKAAEAARTKYPRYEELCNIYDRESLIIRYLSAPMELDVQASAAPTYPPGALGARLIRTTFYLPTTNFNPNIILKSPPSATTLKLAERSHTHILPRTIDVYRLKALVSRELGLPPLQFKLIYESPELDPVKEDINQNATWDDWGDWDVDDDFSDSQSRDHETEAENDKEKWVHGVLFRDGGKWKRREIELLDGFREWGFLVEDRVREARVRIELLDQGKR
jgi:tubulin-specific chaperone E